MSELNLRAWNELLEVLRLEHSRDEGKIGGTLLNHLLGNHDESLSIHNLRDPASLSIRRSIPGLEILLIHLTVLFGLSWPHPQCAGYLLKCSQTGKSESEQNCSHHGFCSRWVEGNLCDNQN